MDWIAYVSTHTRPRRLLLTPRPPDSDGLPSSLETWLYAKNTSGEYERDFPKLRVTLGPYNKSFFATDGAAAQWLNIPSGLLDVFKSNRSNNGTGPFTDMPRLVALGVDGDYFMLTEKNAACWSLGSYRALRELIVQTKDTPAGLSQIQTLYLHPYRLQSCVLQNKGGQVGGESLPPHTEEAFESIKAAVQEDTEKQEAEKNLQTVLSTQRLLAAARAIEEQTSLQRQLLLLRRQREAAEQAAVMRQQAQLRQLNQTITMMNAMNLGMMMGNFGFGGNLF